MHPLVLLVRLLLEHPWLQLHLLVLPVRSLQLRPWLRLVQPALRCRPRLPIQA